MTLVLLLAAFLAIVLAFGVLVAVHDALEAAWRRAAGGRFVELAAGASAPRPPASAVPAGRALPRRRPDAWARTRAPSATAHAGAWRHLH
jgi:hypothetical protein